MKKIITIIFTAVGALTMLCTCAGLTLFASGLWALDQFVGRTADASNHPAEVAQITDGIAHFDVPAGFGSPYGLRLSSFAMVGYKSTSGDSHLFLTQFPQGMHLGLDEMLKQMKDGTLDPKGQWFDIHMTVLEQKPVTVRGQAATLNIQEGLSSEGQPYRMATMTFTGRGGGPALLMVGGPTAEWDLAMVETLIASID